ncbi:MAG: diaminopimelate epimerase [Pseudomonadota bacterium]
MVARALRIGDNPRMRLRFTKMQGAGNDFVVIDATREPFSLTTAQLQHLADRHFGVGADQILVVEPSPGSGIDFRYRIFNADGAEVEHCGNGARCFVRFVLDRGLTDRRSIRVQTLSGIIEPCEIGGGRVRVDMGAPIFELDRIPFDASDLPAREAGQGRLWPIELPAGPRWVSVLSMGNPHAVQWVDDVDVAPVATEGLLIERHRRFPRRVNAGFAQRLDAHQIRLRVFERGVGETLACGTGACAAAVAGIHQGLLQTPVRVHARGGELEIDWSGEGSVFMTGPAETVFEGEIEL